MPLAAVRRASAVGEKHHCLRHDGAGQNALATRSRTFDPKRWFVAVAVAVAGVVCIEDIPLAPSHDSQQTADNQFDGAI